jgi:hypothetical protein
MALAGSDDYSTFAVLHDLGCNDAIKEAVPEAVQNYFLETGKHIIPFVTTGFCCRSGLCQPRGLRVLGFI